MPSTESPEFFGGDVSETDRTIDSVRNSASNLLSNFRAKLDEIRGDDALTKYMIRQGFEASRCFEEAIKFFGTDLVPYVAIDGTDVDEARLDMLIFYAGAYGYNGEVHFFEDGNIVSTEPDLDERSASVSCAIPISEEYASMIAGELGDWGIDVDTAKISPALMRLAEYLLAYKSIVSERGSRIVLLDRTISADIAHISWRLREYVESKSSILYGISTTFGEISKIDLELGRMLISNEALRIPAPRSQFLSYATLDLLARKGRRLELSEICNELGIDEQRRDQIVQKLKKFHDAIVYDSQASTLELKESLNHFFERLLEATLAITERVFGRPVSLSSNGKLDHPLLITNSVSGKARWLNCDDIDYLTLVLISAILRECWRRNVLLLGIAKDSAANELTKAVIPLLKSAGLLDENFNTPMFESDRVLLQANSLVNSGLLTCPWRTIEYDVCFRTVSPSGSASSTIGTCDALGAYGNIITGERTFVKAYFQLWNSTGDPNVRSHVFLYDRPCYPKYDVCAEPELVLSQRDNAIEEKITPAIHFSKNCPLSDLVLGILYSMGTEAIPEALGHNYPLFLADKRAKVAENQAHATCIAAVELELNKARLDQQLLFQGPYRGYRSAVETSRKKKNKPTARRS